MTGTDRVRHCSQCDLNVFNISNMTHAEAVDLVKQTEGRVCVRYYQRRDGTILTRDCSVRDRVSLSSRLALAAICSVVGITVTTGCMGARGDDYKDIPPAPKSADKVKDKQHLSQDGTHLNEDSTDKNSKSKGK